MKINNKRNCILNKLSLNFIKMFIWVFIIYSSGNILRLVVVCLTFITITSQNITVIKDYLNYKRINTALFVICENSSDMLKIITELHHTNSSVNVWNIKSNSAIFTLNYTQFFVRWKGPHTVVVNLSCERLERTRLIFSNNISQSYEKLEIFMHWTGVYHWGI